MIGSRSALAVAVATANSPPLCRPLVSSGIASSRSSNRSPSSVATDRHRSTAIPCQAPSASRIAKGGAEVRPTTAVAAPASPAPAAEPEDACPATMAARQAASKPVPTRSLDHCREIATWMVESGARIARAVEAASPRRIGHSPVELLCTDQLIPRLVLPDNRHARMRRHRHRVMSDRRTKSGRPAMDRPNWITMIWHPQARIAAHLP